MKIFVIVIFAATIIGGFVGGELMDRTFSITAAVIGGVGLAAVLLGLGAFFDWQDRRRRKVQIPDEMRPVFHRMLGTQRHRNVGANTASKPRAPSIGGEKEQSFLSPAFKLLSIQLLPKYAHPKEAFSALMTNKRASGYVFGFHDSLLQRLGLYDSSDSGRSIALIEQSYKNIFGESAGHALFAMSLASQDDSAFVEGRMEGGTELVTFLDAKTPPLGLSRILILGFGESEPPALDQFVQAMVRLGATKSASELRSIGKPLLPQFDSPYVAAMDAYVTMLAAHARPGVDGASQMGSGIAHGAGAICEFVLEGIVPHETGKRYFDQVMEFMSFGLPAGFRASGGIMDFDNMLELHRSSAGKRTGS